MRVDARRAMSDARAGMSAVGFDHAGTILCDAREAVRERFQASTSSQMLAIIEKVETRGEISTEETALMKTWIVGDAVGYAKAENDFSGWISEYDRLSDALIAYEERDWSTEDCVLLEGILEDAARLSYDIANLLEKKERISTFECAVADGLDEDERRALVDALKGKLRSPDS